MTEEALNNDFPETVKTVSERFKPKNKPDIKTIGHNKYRELKKYDFDNMDEKAIEMFYQIFKIPIGTAIKMIKEYEDIYINPVKSKTKAYFESLKNKQNTEIRLLTKDELWRRFNYAFYENEGCKFMQNADTLENIKPLFYYFLGDEKNFITCKNIHPASKPNIRKGLLIVGDYGCGKSSVFWAFEKALKNVRGANFKGFTANEVVNQFEACQNAADKDFFFETMYKGIRYFDDVKTERMANNYGKADLFKDILETRNRNRVKTYITCNYAPEKPNDVLTALLEFKNRYGLRVYDRLFEDFNILIFTGKSFRR